MKRGAYRLITADGEMNFRLKVSRFSVLKFYICISEICEFPVLQIFACNFVNSSHIGTGNRTFYIFPIDPVFHAAGDHFTDVEFAGVVMCVILLAEKTSGA